MGAGRGPRRKDDRHDQALSQLLGSARRGHRGAHPARRGVSAAALAARAARHASGARAGHGLREGVDAHARQLRDRDVRARRPRAVPADAGLAAGARRADPRHRARAVGLLPRDHDPDVRPGARRRAGRVRDGAGDQRADRPAASLPGARRSADGRAAFRRRRRRRRRRAGGASRALRLDRRRQQHGELLDRGGRDPRPGSGARLSARARARRRDLRARARNRARAHHASPARRPRRRPDAT